MKPFDAAKRRQRIWDQLIARAWIEDGCLGHVYAAYFGILGSASELPSRRVPPQSMSGRPVRAVIAEQCPKLSAWLWKQRKSDLQTPAAEDRVVRLLGDRDFHTKCVGGFVTNAERCSRRYAKKQYQAGAIGLENSRRAANWRHEWDFSK